MKLALYLPRCLQRINLPFLEYKDKKLVSLLQMSKVSKVVDENGDPSECICELEATLWSLTWSMSTPWRFAGGLTGGDKWRPVNKEKASAFLSTQEPNYLAGGNIKQKLMSTTKVVKEIEKLRGTEDAPLVASGKLRSADNEKSSKSDRPTANQSRRRGLSRPRTHYKDSKRD